MVNLDVPSPWRRAGKGGLRGAPPGRRGSSIAALGALLDRSLVQIADASSDARRFDRETISVVADVWDNNTFPLFGAATAGTRSGRERRALAALEWMASLGEERRAWMLEQASAAGHSLDELLAPVKPYVPGRDYLGRVMAPVMAVTPQNAESLAADYDLSSAEVRHLRVERAGGRLVGYLELAVARCYPVDDGASPEAATLGIRLRDITAVRFDSHDARGATLRTEAGGVSIGIGARGTLRAVTADLRPDDRCWYLSAAGHRADATTPPRDSQPAWPDSPREGRLGANAMAAATLLHRAMLHIRMVRSAGGAQRVPVHDFHRAFAGAGEAIFTAGAHRLPYRREAAFRRLIERWARRGGPALADWFTSVLQQTAQQPDFLADLRDQDRARSAADAPQQPAPETTAIPGPPEAELRLATYAAAHTRYGIPHDASALVHLAMPPAPGTTEDTPWRLRAVKGTNPAHFRLRTEAFQNTSRPPVTVDDNAARHFVLHDGALDITSGEDWNHDPS
ncbi:hypothetical protein [Kitasatospora sp. NBC_01266]|uniref:hypothetical protein n=1 Tax=Kitasatospora sp. NBC_01266 TaxID=2903572 RepID=UPI002E358098|nr:hypothetical protein [Kitasatospora sp. NBC_01266]